MKTDTVILITGVTRATGLGYALTKACSDRGYRTYASGRDLKTVEELVTSLDGVTALQLDITDQQSIDACLDRIRREAGVLDRLINNAAAFFDAGGTVVNSNPADVLRAFDTNVLGAWRLSVAALPLLRQSGAGTIVNVTSGAGSFHDPVFGMDRHPQQVPIYGVTKAAANAFTVKLARELGGEVTVNAVCPGWIATYPGTAEMGARPVAEAVPGILWAADREQNPATGKFFRDGEEIDW